MAENIDSEQIDALKDGMHDIQEQLQRITEAHAALSTITDVQGERACGIAYLMAWCPYEDIRKAYLTHTLNTFGIPMERARDIAAEMERGEFR